MNRKGFLAIVAGAVVVILLAWLHDGSRPPVDRAAQTVVGSSGQAASELAPDPAQASGLLVTQRPASTAAIPEAPSPFAAFSTWAERYLAGDPAAGTVQGEALAWKRRQAMLELIQADPARASDRAAPFHWRRDLPAHVSRHFEHWVDSRGDWEVAMAEDFDTHHPVVYRWATLEGQRYDAFVYGRRLAQACQTNLPLHGLALEGKLALLSDPLRVLEPGEADSLQRQRGDAAPRRCAVCNQSLGRNGLTILADIGGEIAGFCGREHLDLVQQNWTAAEFSFGDSPQRNAAAGGGTRTQGGKTLLYMRVNFPDDLTQPLSEAAAYQTMDDVNAYYVAGSYNTTWLTTTVTPLLTVPRIKAWYSTAGPGALLGDAREVARQARFDTANYDLDIVSHMTVPGFDWGGLGAVGGKGTWLQSHGAGVTAHELGHNYGLPHANFWDTLDYQSSGIGPGTNVEYGNLFDTMGAASAGNNDFGALFKTSLQWLSDAAVHHVTTGGVYRLHPFDGTDRSQGRFYAARVRKDYDRDYWLEFRSRFTGNVSLQNGLLLHWSPWRETGGVGLIDSTPWTLTRTDAAVVIGRTFSDAVAGVHITPLARGGVGEDSWIDVSVNFAGAPLNWPSCLTVQVDPTNAAPGEHVHLRAHVTDVDDESFAYCWSFDDGTFSTNNQPWIVRSWTEPGEHVVRCVVSDLRGGAVSANVAVTVGAPSGFRVSGVVLDPGGLPVEGVRVDNGITNTAGYVSSLTDSEGRFLITGVNGDLTLEATRYGFHFTNVPWDNPLVISSNIVAADFLAVPLRNVALALSTNLLIESNGTPQQLTVTRTGDASEDLTVLLNVSGFAGVGTDVAFTPTLAVGVNEVVIPAGSDRVVFTFSALNNAVVEDVESLQVTLLEDPAYVIAPLAEAVITLLDDDQPAKPAVSLNTVVGFVPERGFDSAVFEVSRTGSTAGDLPVFYSTGGTATAGTDYPTAIGVVIIPAGSSKARLEIPPLDDKDVEPDETLVVNLSAHPTYTLGSGTALAYLIDDDLLVVTVSATGAGVAEPSASGRFTVKRDGDQTAHLVVYFTLGGSASNGVDYVSPSGAVTIPAGQTSADILVTALDDSLTEGDETVVLTLTGNPGYDVGNPGRATLTLRDNEWVTVSVTAPDDQAAEPGSDFGSFLLSRGSVANGVLTVRLAINGTALGGADYVPLDSVVVIPDGATSVMLDVIPFDDLHLEPVEDIILTVLPGTNYNIGSVQARVHLTDDESAGVPAVGFVSAASSGRENESPGLSVALSHTSSAPVTVSYRRLAGSASGADYTLPPGLVSFAPGEWAKSIALPITNDGEVEPDETIVLTLFDPAGATHDGIKIHTYTIVDDDLSAVSVTATASGASETGPVPGNFRLTRTGGTHQALLVNFQLTGTASAPSDFATLPSPVTLPAGATFMDLPVVPVDDGTVELEEEVTLTLISVPGGKIVAPHQATVTLTDDDPHQLPVVTLTATNQPHAVENGGAGAWVFTRSGSTSNVLTLFLWYAGSATMGADYDALTNVITFAPGESSLTLPVIPVDDALIEGEETVTVTLTVMDTYRVSHAAEATVLIQDNDQRVWVNASDFLAAEPGTDQGGFTFTRFGTTNADLPVFFTLSGTAQNGLDYLTLSNAITIPAGSLTATLPVVPLDDLWVEGAEQVTLSLHPDPAYQPATPASAGITVMDDEPMLSLRAHPTNVIEGSRVPATLTLRREGDLRREVTARLAFSGSAGYGTDYPPLATHVLFGCGMVAVDLHLHATNDLMVEAEETITATLLPDPSYTLVGSDHAVVSLTDAGTNLAPVVTLTSPTAPEIFLLGTTVNILLEATVTDDGDTNNPPTLTWTNLSGPDTIAFGSTTEAHTTVSFTNAGVYVLRLTADDGQLSDFVELTVMVDTLVQLSHTLAHWTFDEGSGTTVADASGNGHDGVLLGMADWATNGALGGAVALDGLNSLVREADASGLLNGQREFSVGLWLKPEFTNGNRGIFSAQGNGTDATLTLAARSTASCGAGVHVFEGTLASTCCEVLHVSASDAVLDDWQHVALTWRDGGEPSLYVNGRLDQPDRHKAALHGWLYNCPQLVLGQGPPQVPDPWQGLVDDLRIYPRALAPVEVAGLVATNYGAQVVVPTNLAVQILTPVALTGLVTDDGRPMPPGVLTTTWTQASGPLPVTLSHPNDLTNTVEFIQAGDYVFRLVADDGQVKVFQDLPVKVLEPTQIYAFASDPQAAELGPDPGEFTILRVGDTNAELTVFVTLSGTASNGVDVVFIPETNAVVLPVGVDQLTLPVTPFLDDRTEGEETLLLTIVSNLTYFVGLGEATVSIQDSPYGEWTIAHFTLEELTDPTLSGPGADFDHDALVNFVEYAFHRAPKAADTNSPLQTRIELDPGDGLSRLTLTYTRRIQPTDVAYEVNVSTDLLTWNTGEGYLEEVQAVDDGNGLTETVTARLLPPWPSAVNQFITIRVWLRVTSP